MLEGALIALGAFLLGRYLPGRRRKGTVGKPPKPVCGCTHHHAYHDPETGECNALVDGKVTRFDRHETPIAWEQVPCGCRQYSEPVPLPEVYAPEIGG